MEKQKIALYDIDHTLIPFDSMLTFILFFIRKKPYKIFLFIWLSVKSLLLVLKGESLRDIKEQWLLIVKGISKEQMLINSKILVEKHIVPGLKPGAALDIEERKKQGYQIVFATASFDLYFQYLAEYFQADYFFGTRLMETAPGIWKINGENCKGEEKILRITAIMDENKIDKPHSISFSDSHTDLPFLKLTNTFYKIHKTKWEIIDTVTN
ncbi:MAG: HAD-IB family phosphatase [Spirochaetes bacterium]|nr:HAD-IB family phosphatase [Spirochaetota bacterium]